MTKATTQDDDREQRHDDHLQDIEPGAGCTEIWDRLSEQREDGE
jgi:hypothetical protein